MLTELQWFGNIFRGNYISLSFNLCTSSPFHRLILNRSSREKFFSRHPRTCPCPWPPDHRRRRRRLGRWGGTGGRGRRTHHCCLTGKRCWLKNTIDVNCGVQWVTDRENREKVYPTFPSVRGRRHEFLNVLLYFI